jgi:hypothetical protein
MQSSVAAAKPGPAGGNVRSLAPLERQTTGGGPSQKSGDSLIKLQQKPSRARPELIAKQLRINGFFIVNVR